MPLPKWAYNMGAVKRTRFIAPWWFISMWVLPPLYFLCAFGDELVASDPLTGSCCPLGKQRLFWTLETAQFVPLKAICREIILHPPSSPSPQHSSATLNRQLVLGLSRPFEATSLSSEATFVMKYCPGTPWRHYSQRQYKTMKKTGVVTSWNNTLLYCSGY